MIKQEVAEVVTRALGVSCIIGAAAMSCVAVITLLSFVIANQHGCPIRMPLKTVWCPPCCVSRS